MELQRGSRVRAVKGINEIEAGDTGTVTAAWVKATPLVQWDKDGKQRPIRKSRLELI
jgi:hypothetical protein